MDANCMCHVGKVQTSTYTPSSPLHDNSWRNFSPSHSTMGIECYAMCECLLHNYACLAKQPHCEGSTVGKTCLVIQYKTKGSSGVPLSLVAPTCAVKLNWTACGFIEHIGVCFILYQLTIWLLSQVSEWGMLCIGLLLRTNKTRNKSNNTQGGKPGVQSCLGGTKHAHTHTIVKLEPDQISIPTEHRIEDSLWVCTRCN